jgi:hypothetical protein
VLFRSIRLLAWDETALTYLLNDKLARLPQSFVARRSDGPRTVGDWLGVDSVPADDGTEEPIVEYLLRHTRLIPRDLISLGNALSEEILRQRNRGEVSLRPDVVRHVVRRCAKRFGDSQLAQCGNQVSSDMTPEHAAAQNYSHVYTSLQSYIAGVTEDIRALVNLIGRSRFSRRDLDAMRTTADDRFQGRTDLPSVLWQNGLLGYVDDSGAATYYSVGDTEDFRLPSDVDQYVFHPCLAAAGGIQLG